MPEYNRLVGASGDKFYYTTRFGNTLFIVLDAVNDKADDDKLISPLVSFDEYRAKELLWLKDLRQRLTAERGDINKVVAVCHIPYPLYVKRVHQQFMQELIDETQKIGVDILLSGHRHMTYVSPPHSEDNPTSYPYVVGGKRSDSSDVNETVFASQYTGAAVEIRDDIQVKFVNSKGEVLEEYCF